MQIGSVLNSQNKLNSARGAEQKQPATPIEAKAHAPAQYYGNVITDFDAAIKKGDYGVLSQSLLNLPNKPNGKGISIEEIVAGANNAAKSLQQELNAFYAAHNIPTSPAAQFDIATDGSVQVSGTPYVGQIKDALKASPEMAQSISRTMWLQTNAQSMQEAAAFTNLYYSTYSSRGPKDAGALSERFSAWHLNSGSMLFDGGIRMRFDGKSANERMEAMYRFLGVDMVA